VKNLIVVNNAKRPLDAFKESLKLRIPAQRETHSRLSVNDFA